MSRRIVVLGTNHALQGAEKCPAEMKIEDPSYGKLLKILVEEFAVDYIFEEVGERGPTTASRLAHDKSLGYCDVDLSKRQRIQCGIEPPFDNESYVILDATRKKLKTEIGREEVWIGRIKKQSFKSGLMICGSVHTLSVATRLESEGFDQDGVIIYEPRIVLAKGWLKQLVGPGSWSISSQ
jgi:hypothetical protein